MSYKGDTQNGPTDAKVRLRPVENNKTRATRSSSRYISEYTSGVISPEEFKQQKDNIKEWFSQYTEKQKNILVKELVEMCELPQLHLLSVKLENLHRQCQPNCEDFFSSLPKFLTIKILQYLDPASLCRASEVCKLWYNLSTESVLWQALCKLKYYLGNKHQTALMNKHTVIDVISNTRKTDWKSVFSEQYRIYNNWATGRCLIKTFEGHTMGVSCVQFDEKRIVSGSYDTTIKVWNIRTNLAWSAQTLTGHSDVIRCLLLSGNRLISGSSDSTIKVWDLNTEPGWSSIACKLTMTNHNDTVRCLNIHGELLISGSYDSTLRIWELNSGECLNVLRGHSNQVICVQSDESYIISGSSDTTIKIWSWDGYCVNTLSGHTDAVTCIQYDRLSIISGSLDYTIKFWNVHSGACIRSIDWMASEGHTKAVRCIHSDDWRLISGSDDRTIKVWNQSTGERLVTLQRHTDGVTCLQSSATRIVSGSFDKKVLLWDFSV